MTDAAPLWDTGSEVDDFIVSHVTRAMASTVNGALTLETGVAISTTDQTAKTIAYFTPFLGAAVCLYDGVSDWAMAAFTEKSIKATDTQTGSTTNSSTSVTGLTDTSQLIVGMKVSGTGIAGGTTIAAINGPTSITLSQNATATGSASLTFKLASGNKYDVFGYASSGALKLEWCAWTNTSTRATALTLVDGVYLKSGATTRRWLGTVQTTGTDGELEDSASNRYVTRALLGSEPTSLRKALGFQSVAETLIAQATQALMRTTGLGFASGASTLVTVPGLSAASFSGHLWGCTLSNNGSDATNDIDIAAGSCIDSTGASLIACSALTKRLDANWAAGTNQGGRYSGAAIANTTYGLWACWKADGTGQDYYFYPNSGAPSAATVLAALQAETGGSSYAYLRRIGCILRESAAIVPFTQYGDEFRRTTGVLDINSTTAGTSATTRTLSLPLGAVVEALFIMRLDMATNDQVRMSALTDADVAPAQATPGTLGASNTMSHISGAGSAWTNASAQVRSRQNVGGGTETLRIYTLGWKDPRGRVA